MEPPQPLPLSPSSNRRVSGCVSVPPPLPLVRGVDAWGTRWSRVSRGGAPLDTRHSSDSHAPGGSGGVIVQKSTVQEVFRVVVITFLAIAQRWPREAIPPRASNTHIRPPCFYFFVTLPALSADSSQSSTLPKHTPPLPNPPFSFPSFFFFIAFYPTSPAQGNARLNPPHTSQDDCAPPRQQRP